MYISGSITVVDKKVCRERKDELQPCIVNIYF